jgi:integrase
LSRVKLEPGVYRRPNGKFEVKWREGSRQRSRTFTDAKAANDFKRSRNRDRELGQPVLLREDVPTLAEFADEWLERRIKRGEISTNTALSIAALRDVHIDPFIGHLSLLDLTAIRLDQWQAEALEDGSPYMVQRATQLLGQMLDPAVRLGYIPGNPARSLEHVRADRRAGIALAPAAVEAIRAWFLAQKPARLGDATLVSVMAYAGPRPEEAFAMKWSNLHGRRYLVEHKNVDGELIAKRPEDKKGGPRWIELPEAVVADLAEWRLAIGRPQGLIFPKASGNPWSKSDRGNWRRRWFTKAAKAAGYPELQPRDLRHTCASLLAAVNTPRIEIEAQMGHRADTSERVYQHLIEELRGKRLTIDELIAEARSERSDVRQAFDGRAG